MIRSRSITLIAGTAVLLAALLVAGCGGGSGTAQVAPARSRHLQTVRFLPAMVAVSSTRKLGRILVDSRGRTLYLFSTDSRKASSCTGACAAAWPPLRTSGTPVAQGGASASLAGTIARSDGEGQATYAGHPLYTFVKDRKPGDAKGQDVTAFGGTWLAVSATGKPIRPPAPPPPPPPAPVQPQANPIPQGNGGDHDSDNNGGPDDGDGGV